MNRALLILLALFSLALAQEKQRVAVYMAGIEPNGAMGSHRMLGGELAKAISRSQRYSAVNRTVQILEQLAKEHSYQRTGAVDDAQIKAIGKQFGVQFLCIVEISEVKGGAFYLNVQMVDVETAEAVRIATATSNLKDNNEMMQVAQGLALELVGGAGSAPQQQAALSAQVSRPQVSPVLSPTPAQASRPAQAAPPALSAPVQPAAPSKPPASLPNIEMVLVHGGAFRMGCTEEHKECQKNEKPVRRVTLDDFYIGKYEITQAQWRAVMGGAAPSRFKGDNLPVDNVSWHDVQKFIQKLNSMTGGKYRLPTEAEWEYAARGGARSQGYMFAGGNSLGDVGWFKNNSGNKTNPVGKKRANELGIYDMSGNVREWVNDWFGVYGSSNETNPKGSALGSVRVLRGGSWYGDEQYCRLSYRDSVTPDILRNYIGFRLARSP